MTEQEIGQLARRIVDGLLKDLEDAFPLVGNLDPDDLGAWKDEKVETLAENLKLAFRHHDKARAK